MMFTPRRSCHLGGKTTRPAVKWTEDRELPATTQSAARFDAEIALAKNGGPRREDSTTEARTIPTASRFRSTASAHCGTLRHSQLLLRVHGCLHQQADRRRCVARAQHGVFVIERLLDIAARDLGRSRRDPAPELLSADDFRTTTRSSSRLPAAGVRLRNYEPVAAGDRADWLRCLRPGRTARLRAEGSTGLGIVSPI
jgi:hypothetical protein